MTSAQLIDGNLLNGEIRFCSGTDVRSGYASTVKGLQVIAPRNKVDYGFANVMGVCSGNVNADALVNVFTAGKHVMPMYAVQGCDYGLQTLADPATGHVVTPTVVLAFNSDTNGTKLNADSQVRQGLLRARGDEPRQELHRQHPDLRGLQVDDSRYIGFFRVDDTDPALVVKQTAWWLSSDATKTNLNTGTPLHPNPARPSP